MSIDPGKGLGHATWDNERFKKLVAPVDHGVFLPSGRREAQSSVDAYIYGIEETTNELARLLKTREYTRAFIEWPMFFDSDFGHEVARGGDLVKLCAATGMIIRTCASAGCKVTTVPVNTWKGQMDKDATQHRVEKRLFKIGETGKVVAAAMESHDIDAIGIGFWAKGFF